MINVTSFLLIFCYYAYTAFDMLQQIAFNFWITAKVKEARLVVSTTGHELSLDDIINVLFILFLIVGSPDIGEMIYTFEPYMNSFAFHAFNEFLNQAKLREIKAVDDDQQEIE